MFKKIIILGFIGFAITTLSTSCQNKKCEEKCENAQEGTAMDASATDSTSTDTTGKKACCKGEGATCSKEEKEACEKGGEKKECCKNKEKDKEVMVEPK